MTTDSSFYLELKAAPICLLKLGCDTAREGKQVQPFNNGYIFLIDVSLGVAVLST